MSARNFLASILVVVTALGLFSDPELLAFDPSLEEDTVSEAGRFLSVLKEAKTEPTFPGRDLFEEWLGEEATQARFRLERIERTDPPVIYQGIMEDSDGGLIAQVNLEGVSHFVKEGSEIKGWKVLSLAKEEIQIASPEGEAITFPYRMRVPGRVTFALIVKEPEGRSYRVSVGEEIEGYEVTEIGEALVTLVRDKEIISLKPEPEANAAGPGKMTHERGLTQ